MKESPPRHDRSLRPLMGLAYSWAAILVATVTYIVVLAPRMPPPQQPICGATRAFLAGMDQKMFASVYAAPVDGPTTAAARHVEGLMARYRDAAGGKLAYDVFRDGDEVTRARASTEHVAPADYTGPSGEKKQVLLGVAFTYAGEHDDIGFVPPPQAASLELWATEKMKDLVRKVEGPKLRVGVLVGHGEPRLDAPDLVPGGAYSMAGILTQSFPFIELVDVDIAGGARAVDPSLAGLVVQQPAEDVTAAELLRIDDFVMTGKALVVFVSAVNVKAGDPTMAATLGTHGLSKLTTGYAIEIASDAVLDFGEYYESPELASLPPRRFPDIPLVVDSKKPDDSFLDATFLPFAPLQGIVVPFASSVVLHPELQPGARLRVVARTSARASHVTSPQVSLDPERDFAPLEGTSRFDLGAVATGPLRSALRPGVTARSARVFVLASSAFLGNPFARAGEGETEQAIGTAYARALVTPIVLALKSTIEWMASSDAELVCAEAILGR